MQKATVGLLLALVATTAMAQAGDPAVQRKVMLERAITAELPGSWSPAPVSKLSQVAANYAQRMCSAVFIAGMAPAAAKISMGDENPLVPPIDRLQLGDPIVDRQRREIRVAFPGGKLRAARRVGSQGCVIVPEGASGLLFRPSVVEPLGRYVEPATPASGGPDPAAIAKAIDVAFAPDDAMTQAMVVTWKGRVIGERYGLGAGPDTPLEGWSMGKSVVASLLGTLMQRGVYSLDQPAPIPEWQKPGTIGRYRNTDPVLGSYLVKLGAAKLGLDYHAYPQRALFDPLGIRTAVLETDASGNFITQGAELMSARDWARLGNLYLSDGVWNGQRLLPEGFVGFVRTPAPAWVADGRPIYGGFFWIPGDGALGMPKDAYYMAGAGEQYTIIIPSHDLVVTRLGRFAGRRQATPALTRSLALLLQAVPKSR